MTATKPDYGASFKKLKKNVEQSVQRRKRFQDDELRYTTIWHHTRKKFDLSVAEYVMADAIHGLSGNRGAVPGWCYASRTTLGKFVGVTRQGAQKIIDRLSEKGLVEENEETRYLKATEKWVYAVELQRRRAHPTDVA